MKSMTFRLAVPQAPVRQRAVNEYDWELDNIQSVLGDICRELAAIQARFELKLGDEVIPGTVETELAIAMEQMPAVLHQLAQGGNARFELFEQGVELCLTLTPRGTEIVLAVDDLFFDRTARRPSAVYCATRTEVLEELFALVSEFLSSAHAHCEYETSHPWFVEFEEELLDGVRALNGPVLSMFRSVRPRT